MEINIEIKTKDLEKSIVPVGETNEDNRRYKNLEERIDIIENLMYDIYRTATCKDRVEYSMKKAGKRADEFVKSLAE